MDFIKKHTTLIVLLTLASIALFFSAGYCTNIYIDVGREMYYPMAILEGKILYKDLFCIYGPFSYLLNALSYKLFGSSLNSLYAGGIISGLLIVSFVYAIGRKFLSNLFATSITLFVIATGCLATRIFSFTLPYSYAVVYGLVCFLISIYFLISFIETKKEKFLLLSSVFCALSVVNKYDFGLYFIPFLIVCAKTKNPKLIFKTLSLWFFVALIPFAVLFIQGLDFKSLVNSAFLVKSFTQTQALKDFYLTQGVYYTKRVWINWLFEIFHYIPCFLIGLLGLTLFQKKNIFIKILGSFLILLVVCGMYLTSNIGSYLFMTFLTFALALLFFKRNSYAENIFILSAFLVSLKSLWGLSHANYGLYYIGAVFISFFILISKTCPKNVQKAFLIMLLGMTIKYADNSFYSRLGQTGQIETSKGKLVTIESYAKTANGLLEFLNNVEDNSSVMVFPEGLSINFLADKKLRADYFYTSLIPLYTEGFGEDVIVEEYKNKKPDYIVFYDMPMLSYNKDEICTSYAFGFCDFVWANYMPVKKIEGAEDNFFIFKRK